MQAVEMLKKYKKRVDPLMRGYFAEKIEQAKKIDPLAKEAVKMIADFTLSSGKRIRPALVYYGYLAAGGKEEEKIIEASMGIELAHSFLLIHDDIIDRDEKRHGISTLHESYKKIGRRIAPKKDVVHFGNSMAMIAGDMAAAMANQIIFNSRFSPEVIIRALDKLQDIIYVTIPGEMLDVVLEFRGRATEKEIYRMFEGKTSRYTFEGPLHLGCILAGGKKEMFTGFTEYSLPLGKAFQLQDDILGVFGEEKKLGKPVGSDVSEGKQTILLLRAKEKGSREQRRILDEYLGKKDLKKRELEEFRRVMKETGSLEYCQKSARRFVGESLSSLEKIDFKNKEARIFLESLAHYIIEREV